MSNQLICLLPFVHKLPFAVRKVTFQTATPVSRYLTLNRAKVIILDIQLKKMQQFEHRGRYVKACRSAVSFLNGKGMCFGPKSVVLFSNDKIKDGGRSRQLASEKALKMNRSCNDCAQLMDFMKFCAQLVGYLLHEKPSKLKRRVPVHSFSHVNYNGGRKP